MTYAKMKPVIPVILFTIGLLIPIMPVSGDAQTHHILIYRDKAEIKPGTTFTIFAQVYWGVTPVDSSQIRISSWNFDWDDELMSKVSSSGLFRYRVSLPSDFEDSWLAFDLIAYIDGLEVADGWYGIDFPIQPSTPVTTHSFSQGHLSPGETLEIYSYMPEMADGRISNGMINVQIVTDPDGVIADFPAIYKGNGIFRTFYQLPTDLDLTDPRWSSTELEVKFEIQGLEEEWDGFSFPLGDFRLNVDTRVKGDNLEVNMSVFDWNFQPVSAVNLNLTITQDLDLLQSLESNSMYEDEIIENKTALPTDSSGMSTFLYELNESCSWGKVRVQAWKDDAIAIETNRYSRPSGYFDYFYVNIADIGDYLNEILSSGSTDTVDLTLRASFGNTPLSNTEIATFVIGTNDIISITNHTTDHKGEFTLSLPSPAKLGAFEEINVQFAYYNGSTWLYSSGSFSFTGPGSNFQEAGDKDDIFLAIEQNGAYKTAKFTIKVPEACYFAIVDATICFENIDDLFEPYLFWYFNYDRGGFPLLGLVSTERSYPSHLTPLYFIVFAQIADISKPSGYREVAWILDSEGNVLDLWWLFRSPSSENVTGLNCIWTFVLILFLTIGVMHRRKRLKKQ